MNARAERIDEARRLVEGLLADLETSNAPVAQCLMKAMRLARLIRDTDAQTWLSLESSGYAEQFDFSTLGSCKQYAIQGGRLTGGLYWRQSLPAAEADVAARTNALGTPSPTAPALIVDNYLAGGATMRVLDHQRALSTAQRSEYTSAVGFVAAMRAALHSYATDNYLALEFGGVAEDLFASARATVDSFVRATCPRAAENLTAISERLVSNDPESRSAALTACRRLLQTVADAVFPPQDTPYTDTAGKQREVTLAHYKNRLLAFAESRIKSSSTRSILSSELQYLSARLDALYEKTCKGVHDEVGVSEARLAVMATYMFLAEIASISEGGTA